MGDNIIKITVNQGCNLLTKIEVPHSKTLPGLIEALNKVKNSINDFLTVLVGTPDTNLSPKLIKDNVEDEEDEICEDSLSGILNEITSGSNNESRRIKRKKNDIKNTKKLKK